MNILAIGAHPDDLEIGCGGTLCAMAAAGHSIYLLVLTGGEAGGNPVTRRAEQRRSAKLLGAELRWGGFTDTALPGERELARAVETHIQKIKPDLVLAHYPQDTHQDHRAAALAAQTASRYVGSVLCFEGPTTFDFKPSLYLDIGGVLDRKLTLLGAHRSQLRRTGVRGLSILETARAMAVFRGYQDRLKHAEAFAPVRAALKGARQIFSGGRTA
jgi:LmbE family N-acetylglucosaminyl deacetylase